jgi:flagellar secretion chaperone FliS
MNATAAMKQYQTVNNKAQILEASPHRLIQMLMEGGLSRLAQARGAMTREQTALKGDLISKAIAIICGLREGLDMQKGGEVASNLDSLYEFMVLRLIEANVKNEPEILDEVADLLRNIKAGWDAIGE